MRIWLYLTWHPSPQKPEHYLKKTLGSKKNIWFIQVGANDGLINDPLIRLISMYNWKGILLEPLPHVFQHQLVPLHKKFHNLTLVQAAIIPNKETLCIYSIEFSKKRWATGLSTFRKDILEQKIKDGYVEHMAQKHGDKLPQNRESWIKNETIPITSFEKLITTYHIPKVDVLQIDTEGLDAEIIKSFPFHHFKPEIISFEHENLSNIEKESCFEFLSKHGYHLTILERDAIAIMPLHHQKKAQESDCE